MRSFIYKYPNSMMLIIIISCFPFGYGSISTTSTENNNTTTTHVGACGPIESKLSEEDTCYINDVEVICPDSSPPGTLITRQCRPSYDRHLNNLVYMCYNDHWSPPYSRCIPDCGLPTKNNEYPWIVAIYNKNEDLVCTGTIISPFHFVTAGYCLEVTLGEGGYKVSHQEDYLIIAGKHYSNIHKPGGSYQKRKIKSSALKNLDRDDGGLDTALIEVDREFEFLEKDEVRPICLDWDGLYEEFDFKDGNEGISVGWEYDKAQVVPCKLRNRFNVQYWQRNTCLRNLEIIQHRPYYISTVSVCGEYINASESDCGRGLGSGLFFKSNGQRYFLRGTLRSKHWYAKDYLFYSKTSSYYDWLKDEMIKNPRIPMTFNTPSWESPNDNTGCTLPENIEHGKFALTSGNTYVKGKWVPPTTTLLLSCVGATNASPLSFRCSKNVWIPSIDRVSCRPPGTCPSIPTSTSDRVTCKLNGATVSCKNPPNNATALLRCKPFYTYSGDRPIYKCQNGEWDQPFTPCTLECGIKRVSVTELVIGGQYAVEHEYPWVVGIYNSNDEQICGGTIISRKFVLSAAHCFTSFKGDIKDKSEFAIVAGKFYRDIGVEEPSAQKRKIKSLYIHNDYRGGYHKYRDDIALIEVDEDFVASMEVEPVCVDWDNAYDDYDLTDGNLGVVTGWGYTTEGGTPSPALKKLVVPFRDKRVCLENLPSEFSQQYVVNDKICAGYKDNNTNVCKGDSGGGLCFKSDDKRYFIRGIVSITVRSLIGCDPNRFALYTKVSTYLPWLESITRRVY